MSLFQLFALLEDQFPLYEQMQIPIDTVYQGQRNESFYTTFNNRIMKDHFKTERTAYLNSEEYKTSIVEGPEEKLNMDHVSVDLVRILIDIWMEQGKEPKLAEIIDYLVHNGLVCQCPQRIYGPVIVPEYKKFIKCWASRYGEIPPCQINKLAIEYFQYERKIPTALVIRQYLITASRFTGESKLGESWKPAKCDKLVALEREKCLEKFGETSCVLCMETFNKTDKCIQLKCGHIFHSQVKENEDSCSGIQTWLEKNGKCPTCNETIE